MLRKLKSLVFFDGREVTTSEKATFGENAGALTLSMVLEHGTAGHRFGVTGACICTFLVGTCSCPDQ